MMNKKGFAVITLLIIIAVTSALTAGGIIGANYFLHKGEGKYNGVDTTEPNTPVYWCDGDVDCQTYAKGTVIDRCQDYYNIWGLDPWFRVIDDDGSHCFSCQAFNIYTPTPELQIVSGFYKTSDACSCTSLSCNPPDVEVSEIQEQIEQEEQKKLDEEEIKEECPPLIEWNDKTLMKDYVCEWKIKLAQYFKPMWIGLAILLFIAGFALTNFQLRKTFPTKKKSNKRNILIVSLVVAGIVAGLFYFYIAVWVWVFIGYLILSFFLPFLKR